MAGAAFGPWGLAATGVGAAASLFGGKKAAEANKEAAKLQSDASNLAGQRQAEAAANTLKFEKDQAAQTRADNITAQNANFGQWGYRQNTIRPYQGAGLAANNTLAQLLGLPAQNQDLPDLPSAPNFAGSGQTPSAAANRPLATIDASKPLQPQLAAYLKAQGGDPAEAPYFESKWAELNQRGQQLNDPAYAVKRLAAADSILKASGQPAAAPQPQTIGMYAGMPPVAPTPAGTGSTLPFIPLSIGSYASGAA